MAHRNGQDPEWISDLIVDSYAIGEYAAAKKNGVCRSTVVRAKRKAKLDPVLTKLVADKLAEVSHDLSTLRVQFLRDALKAATAKLPEATLYEVSGAIKIVGELHATAMMIGDGGALDPDTEDDAETETQAASDVVNTDAHDAIFPRH